MTLEYVVERLQGSSTRSVADVERRHSTDPDHHVASPFPVTQHVLVSFDLNKFWLGMLALAASDVNW